MTFEEFFIKKKIDLAQLEKAEPGLFSEFKSHFELMGERSFDQVKKFWFNKLRRAYHLKEAPKPAKETIVKEKIASQAEPLSSPTLDQKPEDFPASRPLAPDTAEAADQTEAPEKPGIKPRFTPRNIPAKPKGTVIGELPQEEVKKEDASKPAASYKPRFNPRNIKPKEEEANESAAVQGEASAASATEGDQEKTAKPAFKPRFNMKNIKPKEDPAEGATEKESTAETSATQPAAGDDQEKAAKPAFKPRFNMKNIKPKEEPAEEATEKDTTAGTSVTKPVTEEDQEKAAKPAFKPRFDMKNIKPKEGLPEEASKAEPDSNETGEIKEITNEPENRPEIKGATAAAEEEPAKPAYKPRFKMQNVRPKEESGASIPASASERPEERTDLSNTSEDPTPQTDADPTKSDAPVINEETKPAYKPRFNMKNIKPK